MSKWLGFGLAVASAVAIAAGCGGAGNSPGFNPGDDSGSGDGASGSSSGTSGSSSGASGSSSGSDATASSTSSSGAGFDASLLDIRFPDVFFMPDSTSGSGSGSSSGGDSGLQCFPDGITCMGNTEQNCSGGKLTQTACGAKTCANGLGCLTCVPGTGTCSGNVGTACNSLGTGTVTNNCDPTLGESCNGTTGTCTGDCANVGTSYIGCEYYAVTMSNTELNQGAFFYSVSISNTSTTKTANLTITGPGGYSIAPMLAPGAIQNFQLPWVSGLSCSGGGCNGGLPPMPGTVRVNAGAYHIKSTEPITVYEFNAYDYVLSGQYSFTNDASLLIPVNAMTGNYYVMAHATWGFNNFGTSIQEPGIVDIIATANNTTVTLNLRAGASIQTGGGLSSATGSNTVTLNAGDVLQVASAQNAPEPGYGSDMSGSTVTASAPVEVLGGSDCTFIPANQWACDHIEEINFPLETLSNDYMVTLPYNANAPQSAGSPSWGRQFVKVVGTAAGTTLTADPPQAGLTSPIGAGQVVWLEATTHFHLVASHPVMVGQFMESTYQFGTACVNSAAGSGPQDCGDPALSLAIGTSQFRTSYQFIAPPSYSENWVNIIAPNGATVTVDGANVTGFVPIGAASGFSVARTALCTGGCGGVHSASSSQPFGIEVYGYGVYTSYMYPGGLNLNR